MLTLLNKNIIKLTSAKLIRATDEEDCDDNIGIEYSVDLYKYSISSNRYDPNYSFSDASLEDNQVLLSEFGNIDQPTVGDTIIVSYLYRDFGININEDSLEIFNLQEVELESVPANIARFFLENAPIVDSNNELPEKGGVEFRVGENDDEVPMEFQRELVFNSSKLPSRLGEYAVNYRTGEVIVVGAEFIGDGTGPNNNVAKYLYRNTFTKNLDYYTKDAEVIAADNREIIESEVEIEL
mgnify:CR=1 FL=1